MVANEYYFTVKSKVKFDHTLDKKLQRRSSPLTMRERRKMVKIQRMSEKI